MNNKLPPVIRVFISSTFADMEKERSCFNEVISHRIRRKCAERGLSFFSVDLRWGITEEEQMGGRVLPICLSEIDKCRPFFIGILGNRYGSTLETVSGEAAKSIPWLKGMEGKSVTEVEMLYAVLEKKETEVSRDCAFYLRSDALSESLYGKSEKSPELEALKELVRRDEDSVCSDYDSIDEFAELVFKDISDWLDKEFPCAENVAGIRRKWYSSELKRNFIALPETESFMEMYFKKSGKTLILTGKGSEGKTAFLNNWEPAGKKILVNCGSDEAFSYWPTVAFEIIRQSGEGEKVAAAFRKDDKEDVFFTDDIEKNRFKNAFFKWLSSFSPENEIYIVINDLNLLEEGEGRLLSWLPSETKKGVNIVCSLNDPEMEKYAELQGFNIKAFSSFGREEAEKFIVSYLGDYGKGITLSQVKKLSASEIFKFPGLTRFTLDFLIKYATFSNLDEYISALSEMREGKELYRFVYEKVSDALSKNEKAALKLVFGIAAETVSPLREQDCFELAFKKTGIRQVEWSGLRSIFELFRIINGEYWIIREKETELLSKELLKENEIKEINEALGNQAFSRLKSGEIKDKRERNYAAKSVITHFINSENTEALLSALTDDEIIKSFIFLDFKYLRLGWIKLFTDSDINIPKELIKLIERYKDKGSFGFFIAYSLARLFYDTEYRGYVQQVEEMLSRRIPAGSTEPSGEKFGDDFIKIYNMLNNLKKERNFPELLSRFEGLSEIKSLFSTGEYCRLLFFKADALQNLGRPQIEAVNEYYEYAVKSGEMYHILQAFRMRAEAIYNGGNTDEALEVVERAIEMTLGEGDLRAYLAMLNLKGRCYYRIGECKKSVECFEECLRCWEKTGNLREIASIKVNICNALFLDGRVEEAYTTAVKYSSELEDKNTPEIMGNMLALNGNIAKYALDLEKYEEAYDYACCVEKGAAEIGQEGTLLKALTTQREALIKLERNTDAADVCEKIIRLHINRKSYSDAFAEVKSLKKILIESGYTDHAGKVTEYWKKEFEKLPDGAKYFDNDSDDTERDSHKIENLKELLNVAVSSGDNIRIAETAHLLGVETALTNPEEGAKYHMLSAEAYNEAGMTEKSDMKLCDGAVCLFCEGKLINADLLREITGKMSNEKLEMIFAIWIELYLAKNANEVRDGVSRLMKLCSSSEFSVFRCVCDNALKITAGCTTEEIHTIADAFQKAYRDGFIMKLRSVIYKNMPSDMAMLRQSFTGKGAEVKIIYYMKAIDLLEKFGTDKNYYVICGELAKIFYRRRDEKNTFKYHNIALEGFKKLGFTRDWLIELLGISNSLYAFNKVDESEKKLREGLAAVEGCGEKTMEAMFAGNLASIIMRRGVIEDKDELLKLFEIEERNLRALKSYRDLIISLLNQVTYYVNYGYSKEVWKDKLFEAEELAIQYNLSEYFKKIESVKKLIEEN